jgi:CopG family transcriptional regulator, nickel-responsive regulator
MSCHLKRFIIGKPHRCHGMDRVTRIGISLEPELLKEFDELVAARGYTNRSEAVRDIIRYALTDERWKDSEADVVGTITIVYDHGKGTVQDRLMEIQHGHHANIASTIHIHLSSEQCLEVLIVWGKVREIMHLADEVIAVRGVNFGKLTMTSGSMDRQPDAHVKHPHFH